MYCGYLVRSWSNLSEHQLHSVTFAKSIELIVLTDRSVTMEINCVKRLHVKVWDIFCPCPFLPSSPLTPLIPRHLSFLRDLLGKEILDFSGIQSRTNILLLNVL